MLAGSYNVDLSGFEFPIQTFIFLLLVFCYILLTNNTIWIYLKNFLNFLFWIKFKNILVSIFNGVEEITAKFELGKQNQVTKLKEEQEEENIKEVPSNLQIIQTRL